MFPESAVDKNSFDLFNIFTVYSSTCGYRKWSETSITISKTYSSHFCLKRLMRLRRAAIDTSLSQQTLTMSTIETPEKSVGYVQS